MLPKVYRRHLPQYIGHRADSAKRNRCVCYIAWGEVYAAAATGAVLLTAAPRLQLQLQKEQRSRDSQTPAAVSEPVLEPSKAEHSLWTLCTILSALPFCGWMVWPGLAWLRQRQGVQGEQYMWFAALYGVPLLRSMVLGLDELALISVFFCVLHVQVERWAKPQLLQGAVPVPMSPEASTLQQPGNLEQTTASPNARLSDQSASEEEDESGALVLNGDVLDSWDKRWTLRSMSVSQLLALSREKGIRGRSKMSKRELLEALEAVGVHEDIDPQPSTPTPKLQAMRSELRNRMTAD